MKTMILTAGLLTAALLTGATAASAGEARWSVQIAGEKGYVQIGAPGRESHRNHYGRKHRGRAYKGYDAAPKYGRGYRYHDRWHSGRYGCLYPYEIRRSLRGRGWFNVRPLDVRRGAVVVKASRPNGRRFRLRVDRCTGDIIKARPVGYSYRPFTYWRGARPLY